MHSFSSAGGGQETPVSAKLCRRSRILKPGVGAEELSAGKRVPEPQDSCPAIVSQQGAGWVEGEFMPCPRIPSSLSICLSCATSQREIPSPSSTASVLPVGMPLGPPEANWQQDSSARELCRSPGHEPGQSRCRQAPVADRSGAKRMMTRCGSFRQSPYSCARGQVEQADGAVRLLQGKLPAIRAKASAHERGLVQDSWRVRSRQFPDVQPAPAGLENRQVAAIRAESRQVVPGANTRQAVDFLPVAARRTCTFPSRSTHA